VQLITTPIPGNLQVFFPGYPLLQDLGLYNGATAFWDVTHFAMGFSDGYATFTAPNGQGGVYTSVAAP